MIKKNSRKKSLSLEGYLDNKITLKNYNLIQMSNSNSQMNFKNESPFLLTSVTFDAFIKLEQYNLNASEKETNKPVTDGLILFYIVKEKLRKEGVQYSSPGNSAKRHFILWFNAQIDKSQTYSYQIEIKEKYFDLICKMVNDLQQNK